MEKKTATEEEKHKDGEKTANEEERQTDGKKATAEEKQTGKEKIKTKNQGRKTDGKKDSN